MNVADLSPEDCRALVSKLTAGQLEALRLMCVHGSAKGAAREIGATANAVKTRLVCAYERMGVDSGFCAVVIATKAGLV